MIIYSKFDKMLGNNGNEIDGLLECIDKSFGGFRRKYVQCLFLIKLF